MSHICINDRGQGSYQGHAPRALNPMMIDHLPAMTMHRQQQHILKSAVALDRARERDVETYLTIGRIRIVGSTCHTFICYLQGYLLSSQLRDDHLYVVC